MNYPLLSEYVESIRSAEDNLAELSFLHPVFDANGDPVMTGGNFAVVFKMEDKNTGKLYALKCFTKEQEGRAESYKLIAEELVNVKTNYLTHFKYYDKELFVDCDNSDETEFPVVLMDWVEGLTLDKFIQKYVHRYQIAENLDEVTESQEKAIELLANGYELNNIAYQFSCLAIWLLQQPFAHGDLKPDNIIVKEDRTLVLVDYDGMYVPSMKGQKARELGSPDFRHPLRKEDDFDEHIDDFPLSSIMLSLLAIANEPSLFEKYGSDGRLLLSEKDYCNLAGSKVLDALKIQMDDKDLTKYLSLFYLCCSQKFLFKESYHLFALPEPVKPSFMVEDENLSTEVTEEDLANAWTDEFGVKYSADRKRLLKSSLDIQEYTIKPGTIVICNFAFFNCFELTGINIPSSVTDIGCSTFCNCKSISFVAIPPSIKSIGDGAFNGCKSLSTITIPSSVISIGLGSFRRCESLSTINVDNNNICYDSRNNCNAIIETKSNTLICGCSSTVIPSSVTSIGDDAFYGCTSLSSIIIPARVQSVGDDAFCSCDNLSSIIVDKNNNYYDSRNNCNAIIETKSNTLICGCSSTVIPSSVTSIRGYSFYKCFRLSSIFIPPSVINIGELAFFACLSLTSVTISSYVKSIGVGAFSSCFNLASIYIPNGSKEKFEKLLPDFKDKLIEYNDEENLSTEVTDEDLENAWTDKYGIKYSADCRRLLKVPSKIQEYLVNKGVTVICDNAFYNCHNLKCVALPNSVIKIGTNAFSGCCWLTIINIPDSVKSIGEYAFSNCDLLSTITIPYNVDYIGNYAFSGCSNLSVVNIQDTIKVVENNIFNDCHKLSTIFIPINTKEQFEEKLLANKNILLEYDMTKNELDVIETHIVFNNTIKSDVIPVKSKKGYFGIIDVKFNRSAWRVSKEYYNIIPDIKFRISDIKTIKYERDNNIIMLSFRTSVNDQFNSIWFSLKYERIYITFYHLFDIVNSFESRYEGVWSLDELYYALCILALFEGENAIVTLMGNVYQTHHIENYYDSSLQNSLIPIKYEISRL